MFGSMTIVEVVLSAIGAAAVAIVLLKLFGF